MVRFQTKTTAAIELDLETSQDTSYLPAQVTTLHSRSDLLLLLSRFSRVRLCATP